MSFDLRYYLSIAWRRLPIFLPIAATISVASFLYAMSLPSKYTSFAALLVESPQIGNLATSTVNVGADEQLQIIRQRLMTRANLLEIARKFNALDDIDNLSADQIVAQMRGETNIFLDTGSRRNPGATTMQMSFRSTSPQTAAAVLNEYVTLMLAENTEFRRARAEGTLEFFEQEVERLNGELEEQSANILRFQAENSDALPSTMGMRVGRVQQLQDRIGQAENNKLSQLEQKRRLVQLFDVTGGSQNANLLSPEQRDLESLRTQLSQALRVFSEENPKVKVLRSQIEAVEQAIAAKGPQEIVDPQRAMLDLQLEDIDRSIVKLDEQIAQAEKEIATLSETIDRTHANGIALDALQRDYAIIQNQYDAAVLRLGQAATGERIEVLSKGERISVVEQPNVPIAPSSPDRVKIAGGGAAGGIGLGLAVILLLEMMNRTIRRPSDLTNRFGINPIGVLPVIPTPADRMIRSGVVTATVLVFVIGIPTALFAVHTYFMPLDQLAQTVVGKLGI